MATVPANIKNAQAMDSRKWEENVHAVQINERKY